MGQFSMEISGHAGSVLSGNQQREHQAEAAPGRCDARQCGFERPFGKEVVTPAARRKAVTHLMDRHQMSERRACKAIGFCRMTIRYETRRSDDHDLRERMKADLAPKFHPFLSSLQRFWVAVVRAVAAGCGAEPFRLRSTASRRGLTF